MKSRTSFFNPCFARCLLRRFWPLWALWLAALILAAPVALGSVLPADGDLVRRVDYLNSGILNSAEGVLLLSGLMAAAMAMAMLSYLYDPRACGLVNSLPLRREGAFLTAFLTGLVPMLACDALVCGILLLLFGREIEPAHFLAWFYTAAVGGTAFYACACFCGVLTGHVLVLPAVYGVLSLTAAVAEAAVRSLLEHIVYGYTYSGVWLEWLSPPVWLAQHFGCTAVTRADFSHGVPGRYCLKPAGLWYLAGFCLVSLLLTALALRILKKRHMESAGEIVAVPLLRPVFRVCLSLGCAVVGAVCFLELFSIPDTGLKTALIALAAACVCAGIGFFAAQMLIQRSLRVFSRGWKQLGVLCLCLTLFVLGAEFDLTGYETRVPELSEIACADLALYEGGALREPENLARYRDFHRAVIAHKAHNETKASQTQNVYLDYVLRDGSHFRRVYRLPASEAELARPDADLPAYEDLLNCRELCLQRIHADRGVRREELGYAAVSVLSTLEQSEKTAWGELAKSTRQSREIPLTPEQAESLYREGILPDTQAGNFALRLQFHPERRRALQSNISIDLSLLRNPDDDPTAHTYYYHDGVHETVLLSSENTLRWLKEHLDLSPEPETP